MTPPTVQSQSFAARAFEVLAEARQSLGGVLPQKPWIETLARYRDHFEAKVRAEKKARSDVEWYSDLAAEPAFKGLSISQEKANAEQWLKRNPERRFTRKFFEEWLRRSARDLAASRAVQLPAMVVNGKPLDARSVEPSAWQECVDDIGLGVFKGQAWKDIPASYQERISQLAKVRAGRRPTRQPQPAPPEEQGAQGRQ